MGEVRGGEEDAPGGEDSAMRTVLVVEDEDGIRLALARALGREGYDVLTAANGADALQLVEAHDDVELVVTDLTMPRMSGDALVARLAIERPGLPIVVMSGYSSALLDGGVGVRGGHHFLQKPFPIELFLRTVADALAGVPAGER